MARQKALFLETPVNGEFRVRTKGIPKPGPGEVLVKIHATGLNPVEWKIRAFNFLVEKYPVILGLDGAADQMRRHPLAYLGYVSDTDYQCLRRFF